MKQDSSLLLKHYRNLNRLSLKILAAITADQQVVVMDLMAQSQILIDAIQKWQEDYELASCPVDIKNQIRQLITEIMGYEEQGRRQVTQRQEQVRQAMLASQTSQRIHQAYEDQSFFRQLNVTK